MPDGLRFVSIDAGAEATCGITDTGEIACWAANYKCVGDPTLLTTGAPVTDTWAQVSVGADVACAVSTQGRSSAGGVASSTSISARSPGRVSSRGRPVACGPGRRF